MSVEPLAVTINVCTSPVLGHVGGKRKNVCPIYTYQNVLSYFKLNAKNYTITRKLNLLFANVKFEGKKKITENHSRDTLQNPVQNEKTGPVLKL